MTHDNRSEAAVTREKPTSNKPGDFIWYELLTSDAEAAQRFYASILGWKFADSGQPTMDYRIINAGEHSDAYVRSSNPFTDTSPGTEIPRSRSRASTPSAMMSL